MSVGTDDIIDNAVTDAKISLDSIYTVWGELLGVDTLSRILFMRNTISFDPSITLSNVGNFGRKAVAASGNNVYVLWRENITEPPASDAIWYRRSTNGGASFGSTVNLRTATSGNTYEPSIAASGNNVYVVWEDDSTQDEDIMYRRSTDGGASFGSTVNLSNTAGNSFGSAIAASGNNVYVVWTDNTAQAGVVQSDILYRRSTNGGASFGSTVNLSNTAQASTRPAIAASNNLT